MSFSCTILYNADKKVFKSISPGTLLQQLVTESLEHFKLPANSSCQLKFRRSALDLSQPVRFSNLPNNAQLDLVVLAHSASGRCKVAISVIGDVALSLSETFTDQLSLADILQHFIDQSKLPPNLFDLSPEIVFLRASFTSNESLRQTTLTSLGLSGQTARFQLRYRTDGEVIKTVTASTTVSVNTLNHPNPATNPIPPMPAPNSLLTHTDSTTATPTPSEGAKSDIILSSPQSTSYAAISSSVTASAIPSAPQVPLTEIVHSPATNSFPSSSSLPSPPTIRVSVAEAVEGILNQNFDAVSRGAVTTLVKYLGNIIVHPTDPRFHSIKLDNKVVREKILTAKSAIDVFLAVGFRQNRVRGGGEGVLEITSEVVQSNRPLLEEALSLLQRAMEELQIPEEERPVVVIPSIESSSSSSNIPEFDPYKTFVVRPQGPKPAASSQPSSTEMQLEQLKRKRAELEGKPSDIARNTQIILPKQSSSSSSNVGTDDLFSPDSKGGTEDNDRDAGVARAMMQKIMKREKEEEEGKPLTTSALRELQKLQSEKVYSETIVRVRTPDKVEIVGHFHPRDTLREVYLWLFDLLQVSSGKEDGDGGDDKVRVVQAMNEFELFISPPRTVLLPATVKTNPKTNPNPNPTTNNTARQVFVEWNEADLLSLGLVPAALLSLSWKKPRSPNLPNPAPGSHYLKEDLLLSAQSSSSSLLSSLPQGRSVSQGSSEPGLSRDQAEGKSGAVRGKGVTMAAMAVAQGESKPPSSSSSGKPKWFKL